VNVNLRPSVKVPYRPSRSFGVIQSAYDEDQHSKLFHPGGTACVLALAVEERRCLRHCWRLDWAPARHTIGLGSRLH
jgi:hypothetical protein